MVLVFIQGLRDTCWFELLSKPYLEVWTESPALESIGIALELRYRGILGI